MSALLDDLRQTLATRPSRVVFIVGTGVTVGALRGSPRASIGTWAGLLGDGLRRAHELGALDEPTLAHFQQQLGLSFPQALLGVADVVSHGLGAPHGGEFSRWLRDTVGAFHDDIRDRAVLDALADHQRRGVLLATTNYDHLLETATGLKPTTWRRVAGVERAIGGSEPRVVHLHGEWDEPDSIVLGTPSYIDVARDSHAQAVLTALRTDRTFVFIGCGAGLRDPNLGAFLKWTGETFGRAETRHFRLCRGDEVEALRREHPPEQRIFALPYGNDHADLAPFLRALLPASATTNAPPPARPISPPPPPGAVAPPAAPPTIVLAGTWEQALHTLLFSALSRDQLHRWVYFNFGEIRTSLSSVANSDPESFAFAVLERLTRGGHITAGFFDALAEKLGSNHRPQVDAIRARWRSSASIPPETQQRPPVPADDASDAIPPISPSPTTTRTTLVLDRIEQWNAIRKRCDESTTHLAFIVHGTRQQNVVLFAERIEKYLKEGRVLRHGTPHRVDRRGDGSMAVTAGDWIGRTIAATDRRRPPFEAALRFEARDHAPSFIYLDRGAPLHGLGRDGIEGLTMFLRSELPKALAITDFKHPLRFFFPVEDNQALAQALHNALSAQTARKHIQVHEILELKFPEWPEIEDYIHDQFGPVPGDVRDACKRCYDGASAAGHDLRTLADGVRDILHDWEDANY
jgi:hypothetical protein